MPVTLPTKKKTVESAPTSPDIQALLFSADGKPRAEAVVIKNFISEVDFSEVFEAEEVKDAIISTPSVGYLVTETEEFVEKASKSDDDEDEEDDEDEDDEDDEDEEEKEKDKEESHDIDPADFEEGKIPPQFAKFIKKKKGEKGKDDDEDEDDEDDDKKDEAAKSKAAKANDDDEDEDDEDEDEEDDEKKESVVGPFPIMIESLPGEVVAAITDEDDLLEMFMHYVSELPMDSLDEKAQVAAVLQYFDEAMINEAVFAKGSFRKIHAGKASTPNGQRGAEVVKRMMLAMLHKQAIKRTKATPVGTGSKTTAGGAGTGKKGSGYKGGGYTKAIYGTGSQGGWTKIAKYRGTNKTKIEKEAKKGKGYAKAQAKLKAKQAASSTKKKQAKAAALKAAQAKKTGKGGKEKKSIVAGREYAAANMTEAIQVAPSSITEGASLAGRMLGKMKPRDLTEHKPNK